MYTLNRSRDPAVAGFLVYTLIEILVKISKFLITSCLMQNWMNFSKILLIFTVTIWKGGILVVKVGEW